MLFELSGDQWIVSFSFACTMSFVCGWIADRIMGYTGFGVIGNWLLLLTGAYAGLFAYNQIGYRFEWYPTLTIVIAFVGATAMLIMLAGAKSATHS